MNIDVDELNVWLNEMRRSKLFEQPAEIFQVCEFTIAQWFIVLIFRLKKKYSFVLRVFFLEWLE